MIKSAPNVWRIDVQALVPPKQGQTRKITGGPLLDLALLQDAIASGQLSADSVWVATRRCQSHLEDCQWTYEDVLQILACLTGQDYKGSEWCDVDGGSRYPADAYRIPYDEERRQRQPRALEIYLKFSLDDDGALTLVLVQAHLS